MDTENLRIFVETAHRGAFAAVARDRSVDPSSVSRAVAQLEEELGVRLFQRTTRAMTLTEAGATYLARVEPLLRELDVARDDARSTADCPRGLLRMTTSLTFGTCYLAPILPEFRAAFPNLSLELILSDARLDLVADRIDLAVRFGQSIPADAIAAKLMDLRYKVCASPDFIRASPPLREPADLSSVSCLLYAMPSMRTRWLFRDAGGRVVEAHVSGDVSISNPLMMRDCAVRGLGPALLADWIVEDELRSGALVDLFPNWTAAVSGFDSAAWLIYPTRAQLPRKVRVMIDFLKDRAGRRRSVA